MGFISDEFRSLMLEIWRVKYLQMARFRDVISSIPLEIRLEDFLNDGDSPDIPIPVYVGYLNQIRDTWPERPSNTHGSCRLSRGLLMPWPAFTVDISPWHKHALSFPLPGEQKAHTCDVCQQQHNN